MNILFYSPLEGRSKDTESVMEAFVKNGDKVFLLTQQESPIYHQACKKVGVECHSTPITGIDGVWRKIRQIGYLISFSKRYKIEIIYAQLEPANFIAVFAQFFIRSKVILVRHHVDLMETDSTKLAHMISILTYQLAKNVLVVSDKAKKYMSEVERIKPDKITKINLGFNFSIWPPIDAEFVREKKKQINADVVFLMAARLVKSKRIDIGIRIVHKFLEQGLKCKLIILGQGEELVNLKSLVEKLGMSNSVYFEGYVDNVVDYIATSDMMLHFSQTESSATVVKEAGLAKKPVIVCEDVGDFNDYIKNEVSGFFVSKENPEDELMEIITTYLQNKEKYSAMGKNLYNAVVESFSIEKIFPHYLQLNENAK